MRKKEDRKPPSGAEAEIEAAEPLEDVCEAETGDVVEIVEGTAEIEALQTALTEQQDAYLRLAAEYDNYRKRTAKEKETIWAEVRAQTAADFLPVYDNLARAVRQETGDEAYAKGVQMTLEQLKEVFAKLGIEEIPALGEAFDPEKHDAVMHIERDDLGENIIAEVYQAGFKIGDKIIRHSMVVVAN